MSIANHLMSIEIYQSSVLSSTPSSPAATGPTSSCEKGSISNHAHAF